MHATFTLTLNYTFKPFNIIFLTFNTVLFKLGRGSNVVVFNGKVTTTLEWFKYHRTDGQNGNDIWLIPKLTFFSKTAPNLYSYAAFEGSHLFARQNSPSNS
jgi:hypothetical protein